MFWPIIFIGLPIWSLWYLKFYIMYDIPLCIDFNFDATLLCYRFCRAQGRHVPKPCTVTNLRNLGMFVVYKPSNRLNVNTDMWHHVVIKLSTWYYQPISKMLSTFVYGKFPETVFGVGCINQHSFWLCHVSTNVDDVTCSGFQSVLPWSCGAFSFSTAVGLSLMASIGANRI